MAIGSARKRSSSAPTSPEMPIVYIHGIGSKPPSKELKLQWDLALFGRDMGEVTRMAYWADILHNSTREAGFGKLSDQPHELDIGDLLRAAGIAADNEDAQIFVDGLLRSTGVLPIDDRKRALPLPAFLRKPITRQFLKFFVKDSAAYFFKAAIRKQIQARLRELLPRDEPFTLIAHSLGSVISLEVLADLAEQPKPPIVDLFVTAGSPLGIREIQDSLSCRLEVPSIVERWNNFADIVDPVALDKGLAGDFNARGRITDELIVNAELRRLEGFNPHSAAGYLSHPKVRRVVHSSVRFDIHARFLMARDVTAQLGIQKRHPVLIEILEPGYPAIGEDASTDTAKLERTERRKGEVDLATRIRNATKEIEQIVKEVAGARAEPNKEIEAARIDPLRRFVSARLTPMELTIVAQRHRDLRVYAIWKSTRKHKLARRATSAIQADAAWVSYAAFGEGIRWAVLDTGIRRDHPHFKKYENISEVWDCTQKGRPTLVPPTDRTRNRDRDGHGSHVAGIIAGEAPNHATVKDAPRGVAPMTKLIVYKVLDDHGYGEDAWIIKALDHIAEKNENSAGIAVDGINLSLGGPYDSTVYGCGFSPICAELRRQWRAGVLVVVAAGNEGQMEVTTPDGEIGLNTSLSIGDPANLEDCVAVGSVNGDRPHMYGVSAFSSRGPTVDGRLKPDLVAPGERILSCDSRFSSNQIRDLYRYESGTSMAAPHVSGLLAAFLSVRREFRGRPDEVKQLLLRTCIDLGRDRYHQGYGMPNLMRMLLET